MENIKSAREAIRHLGTVSVERAAQLQKALAAFPEKAGEIAAAAHRTLTQLTGPVPIQGVGGRLFDPMHGPRAAFLRILASGPKVDAFRIPDFKKATAVLTGLVPMGVNHV